MSFFAELKRRNVVRVGIAYVLIAWVLLQAADFGLDLIDAPNWVIQALFMLAAIGLPAVLVFSWVYEMTPEGLKRDHEVDRAQSITPETGRKLNRVITVFLVVVVAWSSKLMRFSSVLGWWMATALVASAPVASQPAHDRLKAGFGSSSSSTSVKSEGPYEER